MGINVDQNSTPQETLKRLTESINSINYAQKAKDIEIETLKEQINTLSTPQKQEAKTQERGATTKQKAKAFFENHSKEHKDASLHGFVCKEWVFWMDDANGKRLKAHLEEMIDKRVNPKSQISVL
ncbi:hypothetical protein NHP190012_05520 [Helicobacter sp. NHP19-012]|uniref:Uncharacterized protein n=1 Tax=Helicobacter gastrofelis TaxID=2849642 RepID=A0ABN6IBB8_9HELI|nr:hypothetical protein NHP190012_05520 [Helicobacter sp. NHP19-012]GMB96371.1 hypothetical protein NHP22001_09600 [Helicobacter sp. NHP22-001]